MVDIVKKKSAKQDIDNFKNEIQQLNREGEQQQNQQIQLQRESKEIQNSTGENEKTKQVDQKIKEDEQTKNQIQMNQQYQQVKNQQKGEIKQKEQYKHKSSFKIYLQSVFLSLGALYMGYSAGVINLAFPRLIQVYGLEDNTELYQGLFTSIILLSATFGCFIGASQISRFGARTTALQIDIFSIFILCFLAIPNYYVGLIVRVFIGLINGINSTLVPIYIKQISPVEILGKTGSFFSLFLSSGVFLAYCIGLEFPLEEEDLEKHGDFYWRFAVLFPIFICLVRIIALLCFYRDDTAEYYIQQNDIKSLLNLLTKVYKQEYVQEQFQILKQSCSNENDEKDTWKSLIQKGYWEQLKLGCLISVFFQFSGIMTIMFYSKIIFEATIGDKQVAIYMSLGTALIQVVTAIFATEVCKRYGRRPILLIGNALVAIILGSLGTLSLITKEDLDEDNLSLFASILSISLVFLFCIVFRMTTGTVAWVYVADILTVKGNSAATSFQQITAFVVGVLFPYGQEQFGIYTIFYLFSAVQIIGLIYLIPRVKETKGLTSTEIFNLFQKGEINQKQQQIINQQEEILQENQIVKEVRFEKQEKINSDQGLEKSQESCITEEPLTQLQNQYEYNPSKQFI